MTPKIILIAGTNGAGKTYAVRDFIKSLGPGVDVVVE